MKNLAKLILSITILMSILTLSSCTDLNEKGINIENDTNGNQDYEIKGHIDPKDVKPPTNG
ncbi:hypothetical protein [Tenacibaculum maritimum]|uniref:hypothetical protein n=1 Tax=Tenacibaculum maritimum TaxID=107401 RepID=UPI00133067D6|nr:hypothetical protein [Tenacibaculum maritimum]MDB0601203.1 hypothetical protein [Tenacibaculum maritimum]MDB0613552.1 hypothetical protein [Tenacibaculum maritimum]